MYKGRQFDDDGYEMHPKAGTSEEVERLGNVLAEALMAHRDHLIISCLVVPYTATQDALQAVQQTPGLEITGQGQEIMLKPVGARPKPPNGRWHRE